MSLFAVCPEAKLHLETLSNGCPLLVIDGFYLDPHGVRKRALSGNYDSTLAYYPGVHAKIQAAEIAPTLGMIAKILESLGFTEFNRGGFVTDFSLVTTPAKDMLAQQKHPHIDGMALAGVVYLNPDFEVGTSFFRHRPTGLSVVRTKEESEAYYGWLEQHGKSTQPATYAVADAADYWEHLHSVEGRFNRLVMYPGNAFHSIAMRDVAAHLTIDTARLTQRFFLRGRTP